MKKLLSVILAALILTSAAALAEEYNPALYCGTPHFRIYAPEQYERVVDDSGVGIIIKDVTFVIGEMETGLTIAQYGNRADEYFEQMADITLGKEIVAEGTVNLGIPARYRFTKMLGMLVGMAVFPGEGYALIVTVVSENPDSENAEPLLVEMLKSVDPIF